MITNISYKHYCNLGALSNPNCFSKHSDKYGSTYYYRGDLSKACWQGWRK